MRIQILIIFLFLCIATGYAKDVITKTDGTKIDAKVEEITETVIKYRKASNTTGPVYTIALESVATVSYENGDIDRFNTFQISTASTEIFPEVSTLSDVELISLAESQTNNDNSQSISDSQLVKIYTEEVAIPSEVKSKVNFYRKIGWIGGGSLLAAGLAAGLILYHYEDYYDTCGIWIAAGAVAGGTWWFLYNRKANNLIKKSRRLSSYSATLIESKILQIRDSSLTAGINIMGNKVVNSHSMGLSIGLNF